MPLSEDELIKRDSQRDIGKELLEAVDQMKRGQVGFSHKVAISTVASARISAGLSQSQFADLLGVRLQHAGSCNLRYLREAPIGRGNSHPRAP